ELYKFSDGTLKKVRDELPHRILDFHLGYNDEMSRRKWMAIDKKRSELMVELIDNQMHERRIIRNLERLVGVQELEMDYKLMMRTNQRDLPRDIPLDRIEVLRYDTKGVNVRKGKMQTKTELTLEQTQQGASDEVLNIRVMPKSIHSDDENPSSANIKQALWVKGSQDDDSEICLAYDLKKAPRSTYKVKIKELAQPNVRSLQRIYKIRRIHQLDTTYQPFHSEQRIDFYSLMNVIVLPKHNGVFCIIQYWHTGPSADITDERTSMNSLTKLFSETYFPAHHGTSGNPDLSLCQIVKNSTVVTGPYGVS
ncbi:hypothetical protein Tco_0173252, partial [Tanacetum coccineum]